MRVPAKKRRKSWKNVNFLSSPNYLMIILLPLIDTGVHPPLRRSHRGSPGSGASESPPGSRTLCRCHQCPGLQTTQGRSDGGASLGCQVSFRVQSVCVFEHKVVFSPGCVPLIVSSHGSINNSICLYILLSWHSVYICMTRWKDIQNFQQFYLKTTRKT